MQYEDIQAQIREAVDFDIKDLRLLGSGMSNTAYVVNGEWVFRFADIDSARETLVKELKTLPVLAESLLVSIPVPIYSATSPGRPYFGGYKLLPGEPMTRERFDGLEPTTQQQLLAELYGFLDILHEVDPASVPEFKEETFVGAYNQSQRHFHHQLGSILKPEVARQIESVFVAYEADPANELGVPVVIHADLKPDHVLFDAEAGRLTGVLDWGDACLGDPDYDFAVVGVFFGEDFLSRLLDCGSEGDKQRVLRKVPFLILVRALQDLMLYVTEHDDQFIEPGLRNVEAALKRFV